METSDKMDRRHDLDALRAVAMLLGVVLHAALSFIPDVGEGWVVQDVNPHEGFSVLLAAIHGFRMPLFFVVSGFFTAMLWRKRGLYSMLLQRFKRIFLPLFAGVFTVIPAVWAAIVFAAILGGIRAASEPVYSTPTIWTAARDGDVAEVAHYLEDGVDIDRPDRENHHTPLHIAVNAGHAEAVRLLLERGADVEAEDNKGNTPLVGAIFFGRSETVEILLEYDAKIGARNIEGKIPIGAITYDWETTKFVARTLDIEMNRKSLEKGRTEIAQMFDYDTTEGLVPDFAETVAEAEGNGKDDIGVLEGIALALMYFPFFHHLWFLWFLCWLVAGFGIFAAVADRLKWKGPSKWLILSHARLMWLLPLTVLCQYFMGRLAPNFGPDTSSGLLPIPWVLAYYAIFFGYGVLYFDCDDAKGRVGAWWKGTLPVALIIVFPLGLVFMSSNTIDSAIASPELNRIIFVVLQVTYTWMMTFACMGLFRRFFFGESKAMRFISDSSYWVYLAHLPLVIFGQAVIAGLQIPAILKFSLICILTTGFLLLIYRYLVRYTFLGTFLNGTRYRISLDLEHEKVTTEETS